MQAKFDYMARVLCAYGRRRAWNAFAFLGVSLLWLAAMKFWLAILGADVMGGSSSVVSPTLVFLLGFDATRAVLVMSPMLVLFTNVIVAPFTEEVVFRMLPFAFVRGRPPEQVRAVLLFVSGFLFAIAHGAKAWPYEMHLVMVQGVIGVFLGLLYLKNGPRQSWSYFSCVFVHAAFNFTVMVVAA